MTESNNVMRVGKIGNSPLSIGRFTYGFDLMSVRQWGEGASLTIGAFCSMAHTTVLLGGNHRPDWITTFPFGHIYEDELGGKEIVGHPNTRGDVVIGNDVWIGHDVTILSGITIGDGAVLATKAVVVKDVAPYEIVGGNPAKRLKMRFSDDIIERLLRLRWWEFNLDDIKLIAAKLSQPPTVELLDELLSRYRG